MKTQLITALSIVGVLATAGTAMAVNSDALTSAVPGAIGEASDALLPKGQETVVEAPVALPSATPSPSDIPAGVVYDDDDTTDDHGGYTDDDDDDDDSYEDESDDHEDESDDDGDDD